MREIGERYNRERYNRERQEMKGEVVEKEIGERERGERDREQFILISAFGFLFKDKNDVTRKEG